LLSPAAATRKMYGWQELGLLCRVSLYIDPSNAAPIVRRFVLGRLGTLRCALQVAEASPGRFPQPLLMRSGTGPPSATRSIS
jgi:hypothetical protein